MKKIIGKFVLFITGWKTSYLKQFHTDKCVMIAAPHTSNWDLLYALAIYWKEGVNAKFLIKDVYTKGLQGVFFKWAGAIGVDRSKNNNMVEYAVGLFRTLDKLVLLIPAEGTRKRVKKWRMGFYHIAKNANVPVSLGYLDYKHKIAGIGGLITLSGDIEKDMRFIEDFYKDITGKYPELYNKKIF